MKKYLTFLLIMIGVSAYGQTNTFPASGNVGIGTTTPVDKLSIQGDDQSVSVSASTFNFSAQNPIGAKFGFWNNIGAAGVKFYRWLGGATNFHVAYIGQAGQNNGDFGLDFKTDAVNSLTDATTSRLFISSMSGNIGMGTTTPDQKLVVAGNLKLILDLTVFPAKNVSSIVALGYSGITGAQNWALRGAYQYPTGIGGNADGGDLDIIKSLDGNTILGTKTDGTPLGNVGIGTTNPQGYKLAVNGTIRAQEIKVESSNWPDYVFTPEHKLPSLETLATQIKEQGHLPNIPSAEEVGKNGIALGEINKKLLEKVEELTLYAIKQNEEIKELKTIKEESKQQKELIEKLLQRIEKLENKK